MVEADVEAAKDEYYRLAGWDQATGNPTAATLERLGLGWVPGA
jgi:aldehyde:ferredoxin oxidoreductase